MGLPGTVRRFGVASPLGDFTLSWQNSAGQAEIRRPPPGLRGPARPLAQRSGVGASLQAPAARREAAKSAETDFAWLLRFRRLRIVLLGRRLAEHVALMVPHFASLKRQEP